MTPPANSPMVAAGTQWVAAMSTQCCHPIFCLRARVEADGFVAAPHTQPSVAFARVFSRQSGPSYQPCCPWRRLEQQTDAVGVAIASRTYQRSVAILAALSLSAPVSSSRRTHSVWPLWPQSSTQSSLYRPCPCRRPPRAADGRSRCGHVEPHHQRSVAILICLVLWRPPRAADGRSVGVAISLISTQCSLFALSLSAPARAADGRSRCGLLRRTYQRSVAIYLPCPCRHPPRAAHGRSRCGHCAPPISTQCCLSSCLALVGARLEQQTDVSVALPIFRFPLTLPKADACCLVLNAPPQYYPPDAIGVPICAAPTNAVSKCSCLPLSAPASRLSNSRRPPRGGCPTRRSPPQGARLAFLKTTAQSRKPKRRALPQERKSS